MQHDADDDNESNQRMKRISEFVSRKSCKTSNRQRIKVQPRPRDNWDVSVLFRFASAIRYALSVKCLLYVGSAAI